MRRQERGESSEGQRKEQMPGVEGKGELTATDLITRTVITCLAALLCEGCGREGNGEDGYETHS